MKLCPAKVSNVLNNLMSGVFFTLRPPTLNTLVVAQFRKTQGVDVCEQKL